ncbi:hypothetical protein BDK51DRAFT_31423 [Blyttiomyces helicus]|uniref:Uncharacterized protein n=1 Tax=Blyttiomyces helicus TaxID=388810 RepID=A0A4P9WCH0_9FUNG|nr:hypothetical protein BDK51DRAFT_31423 [Blyttiomyces helicus]|eukprot:RKO88056.1 hypothetical protein BDK51DRAFT_31423 [Blyttiomyces helicus]
MTRSPHAAGETFPVSHLMPPPPKQCHQRLEGSRMPPKDRRGPIPAPARIYLRVWIASLFAEFRPHDCSHQQQLIPPFCMKKGPELGTQSNDVSIEGNQRLQSLCRCSPHCKVRVGGTPGVKVPSLPTASYGIEIHAAGNTLAYCYLACLAPHKESTGFYAAFPEKRVVFRPLPPAPFQRWTSIKGSEMQSPAFARWANRRIIKESGYVDAITIVEDRRLRMTSMDDASGGIAPLAFGTISLEKRCCTARCVQVKHLMHIQCCHHDQAARMNIPFMGFAKPSGVGHILTKNARMLGRQILALVCQVGDVEPKKKAK